MMTDYQQYQEVKLMLRELYQATKKLKKLTSPKKGKTPSFRGSADIYEHCRDFALLPHEEFWALCLNNQNKVICEIKLSEGTDNASLVAPREVFRELLKENAQQVIFVHNHPSGDPEPSAEDKTVTTQLYAAGEMLGLKVLDHIIIGDGKYYSLRDNGFLRTL